MGEDCYELYSHGYTGYNNRDNGRSDGQWNEPVYGTNDDWWQCAKKCDDYGEGCAGWTFVYNSSGTDQFQCWLKPTLGNKDPNSWPFSANDISGLSRSTAPTTTGGSARRSAMTTAKAARAGPSCTTVQARISSSAG